MITMMTVAAWLAGIQPDAAAHRRNVRCRVVAGGVSAAADDPLTRPIGGARQQRMLALPAVSGFSVTAIWSALPG